MDSISNLKAENSHQSEVVVGNHNINKNSSAQQSNIKNNQSDPKDTNFEYEDNEWDIGIGDLIIDLDADIEKSSKIESSFISPLDPVNNKKTAAASKNIKEGIETEKGVLKKNLKVKSDSIKMSSVNNSNANKNLSKMSIDHQATLDKGLKMKIKRTKTGKTSESKHEIVKTESNGNMNVDDQNCEKSGNLVTASQSSSSGKRTSSNHKKDKVKEKTHNKDKQDSSNQDIIIAEPISCTKSNDLHNRLSNPTSLNTDKQVSGVNVSGSLKNTVMIKKESMKPQQTNSSSSMASASTMFHNLQESKEDNALSPPIKRSKCEPKNMVDVCVGTSIGTITEPDCLGPCEPGTSVTLEGIVWHETEGGVLAVNVTWRGKTYVGTLIDCTKHDWAPPRFCDSPTEDLESRMQKSGRSKRARNSTTSNHELMNFTETRSSVHSKLRNGGSKGRPSRNSSVGATNITPSTSPTAFLVPKSTDKRRKSKDESPSASNGNSSSSNVSSNTINATNCTPNLKKPKNTTSPCAISPVLIECPEQDCSKKYKHANGLKYHQSHAHGIITSAEDETIIVSQDDSSLQYSSSSASNEKAPEGSTAEPSSIAKLETTAQPPVPVLTTPEKPLIIKSVLQLQNEGKEIAAKTPNDDDSKTVEEDSSVDASVKTIPSTENLDKSKTVSQFGAVNPDFEQISNDSIGDTSIQANNLNFFQINSQSKVPSAKNKKNRKSPGPDTVEDHSLNRSENVRSPAYSDISDDSNAPIDNHIIDKSKQTAIQKITSDHQTNSLMIGGYNNLSFYPSPSFLQNPDNQISNKSISNVMNYGEYGKPRDPQPQHNPLDLIGNLHIAKNNQEPANNKTAPPTKVMHQHFPYNLVQGNYPYNMDATFGMQNVSSEEGKPVAATGKDEQLSKEALYNAESSRHGIPTKQIKIESGKEIKSEPPSPIDQPHQHPGFYPNLYSRHPLNLPSSREEDIHRRLNTSATSISSIKEEQQQLPSQSSSQPMNYQTSSQLQKHNNKSLPIKSTNISTKDIKHEDKDYKMKQEGQKPTMETQGPPPPPTNQYYLPYIGPGGSPFFPDPSHSLYRNMLVPPYNTPYHLPIARFPTPEDLSRNTKALDLLQQHASQYYNTHKIHELSDRVNHLKSPTSNNAKLPSSVIPSPNMNPPASSMAGNSSLPSSNISNNSLDVNNVNSNEKIMSNSNDDNLNEHDDADKKNSSSSNVNGENQDNISKSEQHNESKSNENDRISSSPSNHPNSQLTASKMSNERNDRIDSSNNISRTNSSPSTQRHIHTHHHTHVGVYPMSYPAPYVNPAVLASQQATVINPINPFANSPHK